VRDIQNLFLHFFVVKGERRSSLSLSLAENARSYSKLHSAEEESDRSSQIFSILSTQCLKTTAPANLAARYLADRPRVSDLPYIHLYIYRDDSAPRSTS
jgi:hypothetical protein